MRCAKDDAGDCCGKCGVKEMKIIAVIPVYGRRPLLKHTITRLLKKNGVYKVICVGDQSKDERECRDAGAEWVYHDNKPLAAKWNAGFIAAKEHKPDACLFVGSSDWISDNWLTVLGPHIDHFDLIGLPGCYFLDIKTGVKRDFRACYWPGYIGPREGESIGIGRLISAKVLEKLNWEPFDSSLDHSLDFSMVKRVKKADGKILLVKSLDLKSISVSCDQWPNKHSFEAHWSNRLPSEKIAADKIIEWFPEVNMIFQ
jgi:glycosyltransferase involved in cell wall biosynthesis